MVGQGWVQPMVDKVEALQAYTTLKTKKQNKSFVGLANYYWKFILHFFEMIASLTDLIKGPQYREVKWTEGAQEAFE